MGSDITFADIASRNLLRETQFPQQLSLANVQTHGANCYRKAISDILATISSQITSLNKSLVMHKRNADVHSCEIVEAEIDAYSTMERKWKECLK